MTRNFIALAALMATVPVAMAAPATLAAWDGNATIQSRGLAGVQFVTTTNANGDFVALGAHPYRDGVTMPHDGSITYFGNPGLSDKANPGDTRYNWSFDFAWSCDSCTATLTIADNNDASNVLVLAGLTATDINVGPLHLESWNLAFIPGFDFNPYASSSTNFTLSITGVTGGPALTTSINVDVNGVPEPASLALAGIALSGLAFSRRRKV